MQKQKLKTIRVMAAAHEPRGIMDVGDARWPCALGAGGLTDDKIEGDGKTPIGTFMIGQLWYRPDRFSLPEGHPASRAITPQDGWSDDPTDPLYNRAVKRPHDFSHETLWRTDGLYDAFFEIGYNSTPPIVGRGSAIFLHLEKNNYQATRGCIAVSRPHMTELISRITPETRIEIAFRSESD